MLGLLNILPLMKGWDYKINTWTRTVRRGETIEVERIEDMGGLFGLTLVTDDCYGGFNFSAQGADLNLFTIVDTYPKIIYDIGAYVQDASGWMQRYYRPNPQSSAGAYFAPIFSAGFEGSTFPYVPTTIVRLFLRTESTQETATVSVSAYRIIITDKKQFIKSLRAIIGANVIQEIDPALLVAGMQEILQKGWSEKEAKKP
jgi:hypothetical protein